MMLPSPSKTIVGRSGRAVATPMPKGRPTPIEPNSQGVKRPVGIRHLEVGTHEPTEVADADHHGAHPWE